MASLLFDRYVAIRNPTKLPLSPRGRGLRRLSERSDPRVERARGLSWVRARAVGAQRASAACHGRDSLALLRARVAVAAPPLIQLRLGSAAPRQAFVSFSRKGRRGTFSCAVSSVATASIKAGSPSIAAGPSW